MAARPLAQMKICEISKFGNLDRRWERMGREIQVHLGCIATEDM
jgi:hypothetical protein